MTALIIIGCLLLLGVLVAYVMLAGCAMAEDAKYENEGMPPYYGDTPKPKTNNPF